MAHQPFILGTQPDGTPATYDPPSHGHLTVVGAAGTGKTEVLRTLAAAAYEREDLLYVLTKDSGAYDRFDSAMTASAPAGAAILLGNIVSAALAQRANSLPHEPMLVIVDDIAAFLTGPGLRRAIRPTQILQ